MVICLGKYPLVVFLHGNCSEDASAQDHTRWFRLPQALARSGFIVAIPDLAWGGGPYPWSSPSSIHDSVTEVIDWLYSSWPEREWLGSESSLALAGYSYGALLAGRLSTEIPNSAFVSIGGGWAEWPSSPPQPLPNLTVPSMFLYGTNDTYAAQPTLLAQAPNPSHRVIFDSGRHWDHLDADQTTCGVTNGPCALVVSSPRFPMPRRQHKTTAVRVDLL